MRSACEYIIIKMRRNLVSFNNAFTGVKIVDQTTICFHLSRQMLSGGKSHINWLFLGHMTTEVLGLTKKSPFAVPVSILVQYKKL